MCTRVRAQSLQHERQGRTLDYSPIVSSVQAVVHSKNYIRWIDNDVCAVRTVFGSVLVMVFRKLLPLCFKLQPCRE